MRRESPAGEGPASRPAPTGRTDPNIIGDDAVPATQTLRAELAACQALIREWAELSRNGSVDMRSLAAKSTARLATASAQAASAIARLADAETRQRLATAKIDGLFDRPRFRNTAPRTPQYGAPIDHYRTSDWEKPKSETEKSQFNSGPRVRHP